MQIRFGSTTVATRAAKRLKRLLELPESTARQWTAYVLGYDDWHALTISLTPNDISPLDEKLFAKELAQRRQFQADRLAVCLNKTELPAKDARILVNDWQPSAARPQEKVVPAAEGAHLQQRPDGTVMAAALAWHKNSHAPEQLASWLIPALRQTTNPKMHELAAMVAAEAITRPQADQKQAARRVLEELSPYELPTVWFNLATSLMLGDGGPKAEKRALDLFERVASCTHAEGRHRAHARSLLATAISKGQGRPRGEAKALIGWLDAAAQGNVEAAFNAALTLSRRHEGQRVAPANPDIRQAVALYRQAANAGHMPSATNLGLLLHRGAALEREPGEAVRWLTLAASHGDRHAQMFLWLAARPAPSSSRDGSIYLSQLKPEERVVVEDLMLGMWDGTIEARPAKGQKPR